MGKLQNKVAIVTGAGSGMGKAITLLFIAEGCKVVGADMNGARLEALKKEIKETGSELTTVVANMAIEEDIEKMINAATTNYGTLDILVNNAGIMDNFEPVGDLENATWEKLMKINTEGPFKAMRSAIRIFLPKSSGVIINITSIGGLFGGRAGAAYTASKFALIGLTKNTGYIYAKSGIRCNSIAPGAVQTNIAETIDYNKVSPLANERIMPGLGLNPRMGDPNEIAKAALFLACDDSSFVNGQVLILDGGWTAY